MADEKIDEAAARKARNDAIRRARDRQHADQTTPPDEGATAESTDASDPNYAAFIDRKMREEKERKP
jgi:hypothetical protein